MRDLTKTVKTIQENKKSVEDLLTKLDDNFKNIETAVNIYKQSFQTGGGVDDLIFQTVNQNVNSLFRSYIDTSVFLNELICSETVGELQELVLQYTIDMKEN